MNNVDLKVANVDLKVARIQRKREREARAWEREKLIYDRLLTPNVCRLALVSGIIAYSTWACRSDHNVGPVQTALAFALPGVGIPLIAADAGIKDKYALAAISAASIGYVTGQSALGLAEAGVFPKENSMLDKIQDLLLPFLG